ncbi:Sporulation related domain-containing protein [Friedmanniella luteola]|uniref:Sporulation related domain-containing protein n=1 Tax=Friedmanniella luteola TaxID=546871 RepID=A0A1H1ZK28_9ACTN|nr:phosphodiester glycosidase family protein [Friedmanniella luteola]SDT33586.1 Sporulation related domain-containing protein [Friedmanniella luteola]
MPTSRSCRLGVSLVTVAVLVSPAAGAPAAAAAPTRPPASAAELPLGPAGLGEQRTRTAVQPGVTLTTIVRGAVDPAAVWTVELAIPGGPTSPDPDAPPAALSDRASADGLAARVRSAGFDPRVEEVVTAPTADDAGGSLGWRVRVGGEAMKAGADALLARLAAAGFTGSSRYTGWDGGSTARGPWQVRVLTIDPRRFSGSLVASYGPDLERRETTSALARTAGATAATNAGYFVLDPKAGAPGDPAGVGVYDGRLLSETVGRRPALVLHEDARRTAVERLRWTGSVARDGRRLVLDGIDRVPGLIRNCGGTADDAPTARPRHDVTCTDDEELVVFTPQFGASTPVGAGAEVVLDRRSRVVAVRASRGVALAQGQRSVQATGDLAPRLTALARVGQRLRVTTGLQGSGHRLLRPGSGAFVVNGGPELVREGRVHVTARADGFVQPSTSVYYGFSHQRNPRTFAGVDRAGRTLIATVDGRSTTSLGTSIVETAALARALGMREAVNLDGGGSTTMVTGGQVVNSPSDATGERPVGDALLVLPRAASHR